MVKKDVGCPETKKDLLRKVKSAISATAERFSGNMQNVSSRNKIARNVEQGIEKNTLVCEVCVCFYVNM